METKYGFLKLNTDEFSEWLNNQRVGRTILTVQQHHTYSPDYSGFNGSNHFDLQKAMKNYHVNHNGWSDLGQHFTSFPDGSIVTGRSLELSPACIYGNNATSICFEHLGNFDLNGDNMSDEQRVTIIDMTAAIISKFNVPADVNGILYHHWFNLTSGERNNGTGGNKSCPGTAFFGGNKVNDCEANFLPLVRDSLTNIGPQPDPPEIETYASVTAGRLNVRTGPGTTFPLAADREPVTFGAVIRVYQNEGAWLKISSSQNHWVSARYARKVKKGIVTASKLNARSGPGISYNISGSFNKGHILFIETESGNWGKVINQEKWVSMSYIS